ncbi:MAG TPA: HD domain-containing phosphohydrolase [Gemmatimonadaceae bacterium]|nr:HD domain-containing phosphohydrolase [Gemmatimonadaceae bacterium]
MGSPARAEERPLSLDPASAAYIRKRGRELIISFFGTLRAIKLYPVEHTAVQKTLAELAQTAREILERERELEFRISGEFLFINATRLRLDLTNYASFGYLLRVCRTAGVGAIHIHNASPRDWLVLLSQLDAQTDLEPDDRRAQIVEHLARTGVVELEISAPADDDDRDYSEEARQAANRTYSQSVAVTREVINSVRMGRTPSIRRIKRVVQGIVDQILNEETSLIGLTALRDYDEYTFTHSVNVCIFAVALGRRLGLTKLQLFDLGLSALMHDIGKSRVPADYIQKSDRLNEEEWRRMAAHPWLGVLMLFQLRGQQEDVSYRAMTVAYEHHMRVDMSGYPRTIRPRAMTMTSKIVAAVDGYDAATTRRVYQTTPYPPSAVLQEMRDNPRRGLDPTVVKAFINLLGIYPVGTLVVLDTFELAIVCAANPRPEALSRPIVKIISDAHGNTLLPSIEADLAQQDASGQYPRTIIKTADPDRYGINVGDYLV